MREVDPAVPMYDLRTLREQIEISLSTQRLLATLSSVFGGLATVLAALGLYGVMAFMVAREIGIRIALGADGGSVVWMVMREVLMLAGIGVAIGIAAAWGATRWVQAQLFGIQATDVRTMILGALGIALVAALAGTCRRAGPPGSIRCGRCAGSEARFARG